MSRPKTKKIKPKFSTVKALTILVVAIVLAYFASYLYKSMLHKDHDTQRKTDLNFLQSRIEAYRSQNGKYPSLAQLNDTVFRLANLPELKTSDLQDPIWNKHNHGCSVNGLVILQNSSLPAPGCYSYTASPAGCDNGPNGDCLSYTLTANLEAGGLYYTKQSLL